MTGHDPNAEFVVLVWRVETPVRGLTMIARLVLTFRDGFYV
jgi:hypothetical protein